MDDDERKDKTQSTVSTIKCLRQGNINTLLCPPLDNKMRIGQTEMCPVTLLL